MTFRENNLDDLLLTIYKHFINSKDLFCVEATRGKLVEDIGQLIILNNPRSRISITESRGKLISALGEFLWYLTGTNTLDFIKYYIKKYEKDSEDGETIYGAYGPRLFGKENNNQIENVIKLLQKKPTSRRAVIQIFDEKDIRQNHLEVPCTSSLQFLIRDKKLIMITNMRSNDIFLGLPHDIFCFTMLQEMIATRLGLEMGEYIHFVGSLHYYIEDKEKIQQYLNEGVQKSISEMPIMPQKDILSSIKKVLEFEKYIRSGKLVETSEIELDQYWIDLIIVLQIFKLTKAKNEDKNVLINDYFHQIHSITIKKVLSKIKIENDI